MSMHELTILIARFFWIIVKIVEIVGRLVGCSMQTCCAIFEARIRNLQLEFFNLGTAAMQLHEEWQVIRYWKANAGAPDWWPWHRLWLCIAAVHPIGRFQIWFWFLISISDSDHHPWNRFTNKIVSYSFGRITFDRFEVSLFESLKGFKFSLINCKLNVAWRWAWKLLSTM